MSGDKPKNQPSKSETARRRTDHPGSRAVTKAHTRTAVKVPSVKPGGRLKTELVLPVGIGAVVVCAALGLVAGGSAQDGAPPPPAPGTAGGPLGAGRPGD